MFEKIKEMWAMRSGWEPWYVILRRLLFVIPYYVTLFCLCTTIWGGWGIERADEVWKDLT